MKVVDEEMDGIAQDQRKRLRIIEDELEDVKRRLGRIWNAIETSAIDMAGRLRQDKRAPGAEGAP